MSGIYYKNPYSNHLLNFDVNPTYGSDNNGNNSSNMSGAASLAANLLGGGAGLLGGFLNYQYQQELMEDQNAYNSPYNQMKRLSAAGINPNVAASMMNNGNMAPATFANMQGPIPQDIGQYAGQGMRDYVEANIADSTINKNNADADVAKESARDIKLGADIKAKELGTYDERFKTEMDEKKANINKAAAEVKRIDKELDRIDEEIKNLKEQRENLIAERGVMEYDKMLKAAQARRERAAAEKDELTNTVGLTPGDPWYNYYKAVQEHGVESQEAQDAYDTAYEAEKAKSNAGQEGRNESDAKYHFGMYYEKQLIQNAEDANNAQKKISTRTSALVHNLNMNGNDYRIEYTKKGNMVLKGTHKSTAKMSYAEKEWLRDLNEKIDDYNGLAKLKRGERRKGLYKEGLSSLGNVSTNFSYSR